MVPARLTARLSRPGKDVVRHGIDQGWCGASPMVPLPLGNGAPFVLLGEPGIEAIQPGVPGHRGGILHIDINESRVMQFLNIGTPEKAKTLVLQRHWAIGRR